MKRCSSVEYSVEYPSKGTRGVSKNWWPAAPAGRRFEAGCCELIREPHFVGSFFDAPFRACFLDMSPALAGWGKHHTTAFACPLITMPIRDADIPQHVFRSPLATLFALLCLLP